MRKQSRRQRTFLGLILCRAATFGSGSADVPEQETGGPDCRRGEGRDLDILEIFFFRSAKWLNPDPPPTHTHTGDAGPRPLGVGGGVRSGQATAEG